MEAALASRTKTLLKSEACLKGSIDRSWLVWLFISSFSGLISVLLLSASRYLVPAHPSTSSNHELSPLFKLKKRVDLRRNWWRRRRTRSRSFSAPHNQYALKGDWSLQCCLFNPCRLPPCLSVHFQNPSLCKGTQRAKKWTFERSQHSLEVVWQS